MWQYHVYIRRYFVPLTISRHPIFVYQTIRFVEGHAQAINMNKLGEKIISILYTNYKYTLYLSLCLWIWIVSSNFDTFSLSFFDVLSIAYFPHPTKRQKVKNSDIMSRELIIFAIYMEYGQWSSLFVFQKCIPVLYTCIATLVYKSGNYSWLSYHLIIYLGVFVFQCFKFFELISLCHNGLL